MSFDVLKHTKNPLKVKVKVIFVRLRLHVCKGKKKDDILFTIDILKSLKVDMVCLSPVGYGV